MGKDTESHDVQSALELLFTDIRTLRRRSVWRWVVLIGVIVGIAGALIWLTVNSHTLSPMEIRRTIAQQNLFSKSVSYKLMEYPVRKIMGYIRGQHKTGKGRAMTSEEVELYCAVVYQYSTLYQIDAELVYAVTAVESEFDPTRAGLAGERGLMQLMPSTAKCVLRNRLYDVNSDVNIGDVYYNVMIALEHIRWLRRSLQLSIGRVPKVSEIAWAYNAGEFSAVKAIVTGNYRNYLTSSTIAYGKQVEYYYSNYCAGTYAVYFWENDNADVAVTNK